MHPGRGDKQVPTPKHQAAAQQTAPSAIPLTACRPARLERAIARRAVRRKFGPDDTTASAHSVATDNKTVISVMQNPVDISGANMSRRFSLASNAGAA